MTRRSEFARVREEGRSAAGRFFVLATLDDPEVDGFRFGFITSKRVGKAVTRNLVRRRLRALVREEGDRLKPGRYLVLIARFRAAEATPEELRADWQRLVKRLDIGEEDA